MMRTPATARSAHGQKPWLLLLALLLALSPAGAKVRFGVKGAFQLAQMDFDGEALNRQNRAGWSLGPTLKIGLPVPGLSIGASALYDERQLKLSGQSFTQQSLLLQGDARYGAGLGQVVGIFLLAGPQFSFNMGDDFVHWLTDDGQLKQFSLQETMLSVNLGAGVTFAGHFEGTLRYNVPVSKTADFTWQSLGSQLAAEDWHHAKTRTNAWSVSLTYYF